ncbi:MAG: aminoglycoside nucleotidyltransferase [Bacteroidia bacterium]|nr:aminoglycoside nucleotidyltransferase [Bacteroidia bacterium]
MVRKNDAIEIINYAEDNGIDVWIDGGWGVDALLEVETRPHNDIDLFVEEVNDRRFAEILKRNGFVEVTESYTSACHSVWKDSNDRIIDLHTFRIKTSYVIIYEGEDYPFSVFSGTGKIGNKTVKCIDAENQVLFHLGYEFDEDDIHDVKLLCQKFNIPVPDEYASKVQSNSEISK